jgi:glycolate oxidase FAD binding subunit
VAETFRPSTADELREIVAGALERERAVEVVGRGSKRGLGCSVEVAVEVSLAGMSGIEIIEPPPQAGTSCLRSASGFATL